MAFTLKFYSSQAVLKMLVLRFIMQQVERNTAIIIPLMALRNLTEADTFFGMIQTTTEFITTI